MSDADEKDDLTVVYLWARREAEDEIKALRAEIERLREAIRFAVEAIDGDDIISAWERLSAALGDEK